MKLSRGDYERDAGKGKRKGFFLAPLSAGEKTAPKMGDIRETETGTENKENLPPKW